MVLLALLLLSIAVGCIPATVQSQKVNLVFFMAVRRCANHARTSCCCGHRGGTCCPPARTSHLPAASASVWLAGHNPLAPLS